MNILLRIIESNNLNQRQLICFNYLPKNHLTALMEVTEIVIPKEQFRTHKSVKAIYFFKLIGKIWGN